MNQYFNKVKKSSFLIYITITFLISGCKILTITPEQRGIIYNKDYLSDTILMPGKHKIPINQKVVVYNILVRQNHEIINCKLKDNGLLDIHLLIKYKANSNKLFLLFRDYGEHYYPLLIYPNIKKVVKETLKSFTKEEISKSEIQKAVTHKINQPNAWRNKNYVEIYAVEIEKLILK